MPLFKKPLVTEERLLWSRDERFVAQLGEGMKSARVIAIASGAVMVGPEDELTDTYVANRAADIRYGLVRLDSRLPVDERYLNALAEAVQQSGIADRIGMGSSPLAAYNKTMDSFIFWARREGIRFVYQPLVHLETMEAVGYETLCRPSTTEGNMEQIVKAAVATNRTIEMDKLVIEQIFRQMDHLVHRPPHMTINVLPASLADSWFDPAPLAARCREAGLAPTDVTVECTEQQSAPDRDALERRVRQLRDAGFGFAVDDAGAGYASFALIAKLRPSLIKIDRDIVQGIAGDDAKQALVEAFVGFARRIDADLAAEGIEYMSDFETLRGLGVKLGQGYLLGRPATEPEQPRLPRPVVAVPGPAPVLRDGPRLKDAARLAS